MKKMLLTTAALVLCACNPQQGVPPTGAATPAAETQAPSPTTTAVPLEYTVVNMSPAKTKAGVPFNVQMDKGSGLSFEISRPVPVGDTKILFDGKPLGGVATNGVIITATIPGDYIAMPGSYPVTVLLPGLDTALPAGSFTVE